MDYIKVDVSTYVNVSTYIKNFELSKNEINQIVDAISYEIPKSNIAYRVEKYNLGMTSLIVRDKLIEGSFIDIVKIHDDWFYIHVEHSISDKEFYKCDQLYGLIECIKNIKLW